MPMLAVAPFKPCADFLNASRLSVSPFTALGNSVCIISINSPADIQNRSMTRFKTAAGAAVQRGTNTVRSSKAKFVVEVDLGMFGLIYRGGDSWLSIVFFHSARISVIRKGLRTIAFKPAAFTDSAIEGSA